MKHCEATTASPWLADSSQRNGSVVFGRQTSITPWLFQLGATQIPKWESKYLAAMLGGCSDPMAGTCVNKDIASHAESKNCDGGSGRNDLVGHTNIPPPPPGGLSLFGTLLSKQSAGEKYAEGEARSKADAKRTAN